MTNETKQCPVCAEEIQRRARVCPHCRQWQSRWGLRHPATLTLILLSCFLVVAISFSLFLNRIAKPKPDFSSHLGKISVMESRLDVQKTEKDSSVIIFGVLTNQTPFAWKNLEFDCRYFDPSGALIDAKTIHTGFTVFGHSDSGFRIDLRTLRPLTNYASHQVSVKSARNAAAWP